MKRTTLAALCVAATSLPFFPHAASAESAARDFFTSSSGNIGIYSDYSFRGISQSDENPALQGSLNFGGAAGPYLGVWGSNVDFNDGDEAHVEIDGYAGYKWSLGSTTLDIGGIYYAYPGADDSLDYDYAEAKLALSVPVSTATITGSLFASPDFFASSGPALYSQLTASAPISDTGFAVSASAGYQIIDDEAAYGVSDYADWSLGVNYTWEKFNFAVNYIDTDLSNSECADNCDARVIGSISRNF